MGRDVTWYPKRTTKKQVENYPENLGFKKGQPMNFVEDDQFVRMPTEK